MMVISIVVGWFAIALAVAALFGAVTWRINHVSEEESSDHAGAEIYYIHPPAIDSKGDSYGRRHCLIAQNAIPADLSANNFKLPTKYSANAT